MPHTPGRQWGKNGAVINVKKEPPRIGYSCQSWKLLSHNKNNNRCRHATNKRMKQKKIHFSLTCIVVYSSFRFTFLANAHFFLAPLISFDILFYFYLFRSVSNRFYRIRSYEYIVQCELKMHSYGEFISIEQTTKKSWFTSIYALIDYQFVSYLPT